MSSPNLNLYLPWEEFDPVEGPKAVSFPLYAKEDFLSGGGLALSLAPEFKLYTLPFIVSCALVKLMSGHSI